MTYSRFVYSPIFSETGPNFVFSTDFTESFQRFLSSPSFRLWNAVRVLAVSVVIKAPVAPIEPEILVRGVPIILIVLE